MFSEPEVPINTVQLVKATSSELTLTGFGVNFDSISIQVVSQDCPEVRRTINSYSGEVTVGDLVPGCTYKLRYTAECHANPRSNDVKQTSEWTSASNALCTG